MAALLMATETWLKDPMKVKAKQKVIQNYLPLSLCNGLQPVLLGLSGFTHFRVQLALFPLNFLEIRKEKSIG